jgi:hypothetical protein
VNRSIGRSAGQSNAVKMPTAIRTTAPSITNFSSTTSPGGERDMVAFMARAHSASPIQNRRNFAAPVLDTWGNGRIVQLHFTHAVRPKAVRAARDRGARRRCSLQYIVRWHTCL